MSKIITIIDEDETKPSSAMASLLANDSVPDPDITIDKIKLELEKNK